METIKMIKQDIMAGFAGKLAAVDAEMKSVRTLRDNAVAAAKVSCGNSLAPLMQKKKAIMQERNAIMEQAIAAHKARVAGLRKEWKGQRAAAEVAAKAAKMEYYKSICDQLPSVAYPADLRAVAEGENISVQKVAAALKACGWKRKEQTFSAFVPEVGSVSKTASVWTK